MLLVREVIIYTRLFVEWKIEFVNCIFNIKKNGKSLMISFQVRYL